MLTIGKIRAWIAGEYQATTEAGKAEVQKVLDFIEGKHELEKAIETVEAAGYTVTANQGKVQAVATADQVTQSRPIATDVNNLGAGVTATSVN